jgi:hypothetical protein
MEWTLALEIDRDPITPCRLMNTFRRKGVKLSALAMAASQSGFSLTAVAETPEGDIEHLFHFLRRAEGVHHVTCYRHEPSSEACYVFVDAGADHSRATHILGLSPRSKIIFASGGKYLIEVPAEERLPDADFAGPGDLPFVPVMTTRTAVAGRLAAS